MKKILASMVLAGGLVFGANSANAVIVEYDFTDAASFGGVNGTSSFGPVTTAGLSITLSSIFGQNMSFNGSAGEAAGCVSAGTTLACDGDGIGIVGGNNNDQIDSLAGPLEALLISFSSNKTYIVQSVELLDLFSGEIAQVSIDFGPLLDLNSQGNLGGYATFSGSLSNVGSLLFASIHGRTSFSVARLTVEVVPEPGTLALIGFGLMGLGLARRRRQTA